MFLNYMKNFFLKKILKNSLQNLKNNFTADPVKSIGLVVDASDFNNTESLIKELLSWGILPENIKTIVYYEKLKKTTPI